MESTNQESGEAVTSAEGAAPQASLHTMKGDVAMAIKKQEETLVSIALAEEKKKQAAREAAEKEALKKRGLELSAAPTRRGRLFLVLVIVLIITLAGTLYYFRSYIPVPSFSSAPKESTLPSEAPTLASTTPQIVLTPALVPTQSEADYALSAQDAATIFASIANDRASGDTSWQIKNILITEAPGTTASISPNKLLTLAGANVPEILARSLQKNYMMGLINEPSSTIATPFFIFKVSGYATSLSGLLTWERNIPGLFDAVFGTKIGQELSVTTKVSDVSILGHDTRVFEITPDVGIVYGFVDPGTLVITASRTAFEKLAPLLTR